MRWNAGYTRFYLTPLCCAAQVKRSVSSLVHHQGKPSSPLRLYHPNAVGEVQIE